MISIKCPFCDPGEMWERRAFRCDGCKAEILSREQMKANDAASPANSGASSQLQGAFQRNLMNGRAIELKTDPEVFDAVADRLKTHEIRFNDRDFKPGDILYLRRTKHTGEEMKAGAPLIFTGEECKRVVSHVLSGYGLKDGWVILSFAEFCSANFTPPQAPSQPEAHEVIPPSAHDWLYSTTPPSAASGDWQDGWNACRNWVTQRVHASPAPGSLPVPETKVEPSQCCGHPENCDYGSLGICAPVVLVDKSPKTQRPLVDKTEDLQGAIETLRSIAANTCCDGCQEAARVAQGFLNARAALASTPPSPPLGEEKL